MPKDKSGGFSPLFYTQKRHRRSGAFLFTEKLFSENDFNSILSDHELFVGGDYPSFNFAVAGGEFCFFAACVVVEFFANGKSEIFHVGADFAALCCGVFADTAGEDDCVYAAHCCCVTAGDLFDLIGEHIKSKLCSVVAFCCCVFKVTAVGRNSGNSKEAGFFVHKVAHLFGSKTFFIHNVSYNGRIDSAAAGSHYETIKRGKAHGSVANFAVFNCGKGRTVTEVADDEFGSFGIFSGDFEVSLGDEAVGSSVEAITTDGIFFIVFIRNTEHISFFGHGLMEGGIENSDHGGFFSENFLASCHCNSLRRVVERAKVFEFYADVFDKFIGYDGGSFVFFGTVENAVADCFDFADAFNNFVFAFGKEFNKFFKCFFMGGEAYVIFSFVTGFGFVADSAVDADSFAKAFCNDILGVHLDKLILKRGAACINNKYFHVFSNLQVCCPDKFFLLFSGAARPAFIDIRVTIIYYYIGKQIARK